MKKITQFFAPILACIALVLTGCSSSLDASYSTLEQMEVSRDEVVSKLQYQIDIRKNLANLSKMDMSTITVTPEMSAGGVRFVLKDVPMNISSDELAQLVDAEIKKIDEFVNRVRTSPTPEQADMIEGFLEARQEYFDDDSERKRDSLMYKDEWISALPDKSKDYFINYLILNKMKS